MDYYIIYDCRKKTNYSFFTRTNNDILGVATEIAIKNGTSMTNMRMYRFNTKQEWQKFIENNKESFEF